MGCFGRSRSKINKGEGKGKGNVLHDQRSTLAASLASTACSTVSSTVATSAASRPAGSSKASSSTSSVRRIPELYEESQRGASSLQEFGLRELHAATSDFSRLLKIDEGGFGSVYKGVVHLPGGPAGGMLVAIKRLNPNGNQVPPNIDPGS